MFLLLTWTDFATFSSVSFVVFRQVNVSCKASPLLAPVKSHEPQQKYWDPTHKHSTCIFRKSSIRVSLTDHKFTSILRQIFKTFIWCLCLQYLRHFKAYFKTFCMPIYHHTALLTQKRCPLVTQFITVPVFDMNGCYKNLAFYHNMSARR